MSALWQVACLGGKGGRGWTNNLRAAHLSLVVLSETTHSGKSIHIGGIRECLLNVCLCFEWGRASDKELKRETIERDERVS